MNLISTADLTSSHLLRGHSSEGGPGWIVSGARGCARVRTCALMQPQAVTYTAGKRLTARAVRSEVLLCFNEA